MPSISPSMMCLFQSTLPVGGATIPQGVFFLDTRISIHAPRVGSDYLWVSFFEVILYFNPRSPCGERRPVS